MTTEIEFEVAGRVRRGHIMHFLQAVLKGESGCEIIEPWDDSLLAKIPPEYRKAVLQSEIDEALKCL